MQVFGRLESTGRRRSSVSFRSWLVVLVIACCGQPVVAASLDPAVLAKVQSATFEVVAAKPVSDPLSYDRPLPLDLLPYQERSDKYYSVGTAFSIGHNRYVTAGHVLLLGVGSLWGPLSLRDAGGHVYAIASIEKFSLQQDFVVFSLATQPAGSTALETNTSPSLNDTVYAVGNALGTGVVVRDGLYTSDTPEDQDGRWKWMRFSAAASPGNSGGPLLDKQGRIIGVVLMKSPNENLNFALPIAEVLKAPDHLAQIDKRITYQPSFFDSPEIDNFQQHFSLPMSLADFDANYQQLFDAFADTQVKSLRAKHAGELFPNGSGAERLLHANADLRSFPALVHRDGSGNWSLMLPHEHNETLDHNGALSTGVLGSMVFAHLRRPDDVPAAQLYGNAQRFMDLMLKGWAFNRTVGSERVRMTSLGKPKMDSVYTDAYQRRWQLRAWPLPYGNAMVLTLSLPVPDGYVTTMRLVPALTLRATLSDMQALCDFIDVSYAGKVSQWKEYLANKALLPAVFSGFQLDLDEGHRFSYRSNRLDLTYTPELQPIDAHSELMLGFTFSNDRGQAGWDVADVEVKAGDGPGRINVSRHVAPSAGLGDNFQQRWDKLRQRAHPDDGVAFNKGDITQIGTVAGAPGDSAGSVLYTAFYSAQGAVPQAAMQSKLDLLLKGVQVKEH